MVFHIYVLGEDLIAIRARYSDFPPGLMSGAIRQMPLVPVCVRILLVAFDAVGRRGRRVVPHFVVQPETVVAREAFVARFAFERRMLFPDMILDAVFHLESDAAIIASELFMPLFEMLIEIVT